MAKIVFNFLTKPLGLPIEWYWEYIILAVYGVVAYIIAYNIVGKMYRASFIIGRRVGSFFHWLIRLLVFTSIWAVTRSFIWLFKLAMTTYWLEILIGLGSIIGPIGLIIIAIFVLRKIKSNKVVNRNA